MLHLFTHTDLDGIGCYIVAKALLRTEEISVHFCDYDNIDKQLTAFMCIDCWNPGDYIIISDISPNDETAEELDEFITYNDINGVLLDHHATALRLNKYTWARVYVSVDDQLVSGTKLVWDWFNMKKYLNPGPYGLSNFGSLYYESTKHHTKALEEFVDMVRCYDTWEWKTNKAIGEKSRQLNMIFSKTPRDKFIDNIITNYLTDNDHFPEFNHNDQLIIDQVLETEEKAYQNSMRSLVVTKKDGYDVGICFGGVATSIVCDRILTERKDIDYIININPTYRKLEFRTLRDDIDLGKDIASKYGGGGHQKAAGAYISDDLLVKMYVALFA